MEIIISILVYVAFALVILFGLLTYTKDATKYPQFPKYFRISVLILTLAISIQILFAFQNLLGFFLWLFFIGLVATVWMVIKMVGAKDSSEQNKFRKWSIIVSLITLVILIILTIVTVQSVQNLS